MSFINKFIFITTFGSLTSLVVSALDPTVHFEGKRFASPKSERNRNFSKPSAFLGLPGSRILVSDSKRRNLQLFDKQWSLELQFKPKSPIERISSMCFGGENAILVLDAPKHRVLKFNSNGNQSAKFGGKGTNRKQFLYPRAISCGVDQTTFYVSDTGNLRVQEWTLSGNTRKSFLYVNPKTATLGAPAALAISNRKLAVIYPELPALVLFQRDSGRELSSVDLSKYAASNDHLQLHVAPRDHWFLLNISRNELYILSPEGDNLHKLVAKKNLLSPIAHMGYMDLDIYGGLRLLDKQNQRIWHFPARAEFQALQEAQNHLKKKEYHDALNRYKTAINLDPSNTEALEEIVDLYLILSAAAMQKKQYGRAQKLLRELLEIQPSNKIAVTRMRLLLIDEHRDWFTLIFSGLSLIFAGLFLIPIVVRRVSQEKLNFNSEEPISKTQENLVNVESKSLVVERQISNKKQEQSIVENNDREPSDRIEPSNMSESSDKNDINIKTNSELSNAVSENQETDS